MARKFFYVCAGIFLLALSYHLGARSAGAQVGSTIVGFTSNTEDHCRGIIHVVTSNGDVYGRRMMGGPCGTASASPTYMGNFWDGSGPTPAKQETWGALKSRYR